MIGLRRKKWSTFALAILLSGLVLPEQALACECSFADSQWQGRGIGAPCNTFMTNGAKTCIIQFGGRGANEALLKEILGVDPAQYRASSNKILMQYLSLLSDNRVDGLTDIEFMEGALLNFMRAGYLRPNVKPEIAKEVDASVRNFLAKEILQIRAVFLGQKAPYSALLASYSSAPSLLGDSKALVERGIIRLFLQYLQMNTVYLEQQR